MHPNPAYRQESHARNLGFARDRGFGVLSVNGDPAPMISHIPFALSEDGVAQTCTLYGPTPFPAPSKGQHLPLSP
ncbi:FMN-binding negative transcriptional regulator [Nioella ostreopsis]|uniref:FMN-binding negative transcriptional regulator n=1 Tax=Nioella ostreopsis TaxID=2448479 RepID=UPI0030B85BE4